MDAGAVCRGSWLGLWWGVEEEEGEVVEGEEEEEEDGAIVGMFVVAVVDYLWLCLCRPGTVCTETGTSRWIRYIVSSALVMI